MHNGLKIEFLLQLFFALECLSIWKVPSPQVSTTDFEEKEAETLDDLTQFLGEDWEKFQRRRPFLASSIRQFRILQIFHKILQYLIPNILLAEKPEIPADWTALLVRWDDIYKRRKRFLRASWFYRFLKSVTAFFCSYIPMIFFALGIIFFSLWDSLDDVGWQKAFNLVVLRYFIFKFIILLCTFAAAKYYDKKFEEVEAVKDRKDPLNLETVSCE